MGPVSRCFKDQLYCMAIVLAFLPWNAGAQTCQTANDMDPALRTAITTAGQRYFEMAVKGDTVSLRQSAIPGLASDFGGVQNTIQDHQPAMAGAQPSVKSIFLLNAQDATPNQRAEFWCGVFNKNGQTANSAAFYLEPGTVGVLARATGSRFRLTIAGRRGMVRIAGRWLKPVDAA